MLLLNFTLTPQVYMFFIPSKTCIYQILSFSVDFEAPRELWNQLSKAVPGQFHGPGRNSKRNCLQDRDKFSQVLGMANCPNF